MEIDEATRNAAMERLAPFIGEWSIEATFPFAPSNGVLGRTVFEPILGGTFILQRAEVPHPDAPDSLSVIGFDPTTDAYTQHYFDSRGVARVYAMTFTVGVWTLLRDAHDFTPLSFSQRFTGTLEDDGGTIRGAWESSSYGAAWEHDFGLVYTRLR